MLDDLTTLVEDDPIIFGPSFYALAEGKSIGTAKLHDLKLSTNLQAAKDFHALAHKAPVKAGQWVGKRKLEAVMGSVEASLNKLVGRYQKKKMTGDALRIEVQALMRKAWTEVFQAGLRAAGVPGSGSGPGKNLVYLGEDDTAWLKSSMVHEMRFLNKFLTAVVEGTYKMPLPARIRMYARSLTSFFESARVIGLPDTSIVHWVGPDDATTCPGCRYLFEHSPYSKYNLPTVPRAGACACMTRCRDRLLIRSSTLAEVKAVVENHKYTRQAHIQNLRKLKSAGTL